VGLTLLSTPPPPTPHPWEWQQQIHRLLQRLHLSTAVGGSPNASRYKALLAGAPARWLRASAALGAADRDIARRGQVTLRGRASAAAGTEWEGGSRRMVTGSS